MVYREDISIIMPAHNAERYIENSIKSVISQTNPHWRLYVVDDCSSDMTEWIVKNLLDSDERIVYLKQDRNIGAAAARNAAIFLAKGKYIAFLDSDDEWLSTKLEEQVNFMEGNNIVFSWSAYNIVNDFGLLQRVQGVKVKASYHSLLSKSIVIGCLTAIYNAEVLGKIYMPNLKMRQDLGLWLMIVKYCDANKLIYAGYNKTLANYRVHQNGMTKNKFKVAKYQWALYRKIEGISLPKSVFYFLSYVINGILDRSVK
jgi:glycosyltransferase involved in cell wall biosynthesis